MRLGRIAIAFVVGGLGSVAVSCGAATFTCASDDECQSGATAGVCQGNGYCSFPDDGCPSGQRFGEAAPDGVAKACVELEGGTEGSTTSDDPTSTSTSVGSGDASATVAVDESSGGSIDGCPQMIVDEFDGTELGPLWVEMVVPGGSVLVDAGQLWLELPIGMEPGATQVTTELGKVAGGFVRVRIDEVDDPKASAGLALGNSICELQVFITEQSVNAQVVDLASQSTLMAVTEDLPGLPVSLQLSVQADGGLRFEHSQDEFTWTSIADGSWDACGSFVEPLTASIFLGGEVPQGARQAYQRFEACGP